MIVAALGISNVHRCPFYNRPIAQKFQQTLEQVIQRAQAKVQAKTKASPAPSESSLSIEERLKRLTQLHDAKLISDAEFEQKRKDILNDL